MYNSLVNENHSILSGNSISEIVIQINPAKIYG